MKPEEFEADETDRLEQVKPLYDQLHCYRGAQLQKQYGKDDKVPDGKPIPAHIPATCGRRSGATSTAGRACQRGQRPRLDLDGEDEAASAGTTRRW